MAHIAPLLPLIILLSSVLVAAEASVHCVWTKVLSDDKVHHSFLWSDPRLVSPSVRLYQSAWSGQRALLGCTWSNDAAVIQNYVSLCRERAFESPGHTDVSFDLDSMLGEDNQCVSLDSSTTERAARSSGSPPEKPEGQDERSEVKTPHERVKRGFIVPGTLWCGSGNKAPSYGDLGVFADTDSCCREHDQCKHTILSFQSEFGVFNTNIFTMSHCDCDNKFRSCLTKANDSISDVVGYTFFNLLKMHCFEFSHRLQCTERNWFGMCKESKMSLYAEVQPPVLYESSVSVNGSIIINTTSPTGNPQLFSITSAAATLPAPLARSPSSSVTPVTDVNTSTGANTSVRPTGSSPGVRTDLESNGTVSQRDADITDKLLSCGVYKELDECRNKIFPQQRRYGLFNSEPRTLYHCNCTTRLFQTLSKQTRLTEVQTLLLGRVSPTCFLPQDCRVGKTCSSPAVLLTAQLPPLEPAADVEEQRHLQAVQLKVRRPNTRRAKRKDGAVKLHRLCVRMVLPRLNKNRKHHQDTNQTTVRRRKPV